jgi:hypothetical protein
MLSDSTKRCSRCQSWLPLDAFAIRRASTDGRQSYCRACNAAWAKSRRPRKMRDAPAVGPGEKWCRRCELTKPVSDFALNASAPDGLQGHCRPCFAEAYRARRAAAGFQVRPADVPEGHKYCRQCDTIKPVSDWGRSYTATDGLQTRCRSCASTAQRVDYFRRTYGMTEDDLTELKAHQQGICIVCLQAPAVHVDHDHVTGEVRGMLCFRCNAGLGQLGDSPRTLRRAADYLEGRKLTLRQPSPGLRLIDYPEPVNPDPPDPSPATPSAGSSRPLVDIRALREMARRHGQRRLRGARY